MQEQNKNIVNNLVSSDHRFRQDNRHHAGLPFESMIDAVRTFNAGA